MSTLSKVTTDLADYTPGATAVITATGFAEGGTVVFSVQHVNGAGFDGVYGTADDAIEFLGGDGHDPWAVTDGGSGDLDGLRNGTVVTSWYVNPDDSADERFLLTAQSDDGAVASTSFTDSAGSVDKVYQHWADADLEPIASPEWNNNILNDNKSDYFEGEVVPHVFVYKASNNAPLENGKSYTFTIIHNYYQQNTDALGFDYITTFDASRTPGPLDVTDPYVVPVIDNAFVNNGGFSPFGAVDQGFYTVDADITDVSQVTTAGNGTVDHEVTVTFVYTGETTTDGVAEIYYGLHIAGPTATENGASAWTGGSLQTTVKVEDSGATSLQINPAAIIAGTISGYKFNDENGNALWDAEESGLGGWTIFLDENGNALLDTGEVAAITDAYGFYSFSVTPDADKSTPLTNDPYRVRELNQAGWVQTTSNPAPIIITALDPTEQQVNFGNRQQIHAITLDKVTGDGSGGAIVDGDDLTLLAGSSVVWTYTVTNTGNVDLFAPTVIDDSGTPDDPDDDFAANAVLVGGFIQGDLDEDGVFDAGESWVYQASGTVQAGDYQNKASVTAGDNSMVAVADDVSGYFGADPEIQVDKITGDGPGGVVVDGDGVTLVAGLPVVWTYTVKNSGNVALSSPIVTDDNGTPNNTSDDFAAQAVMAGGIVQGDSNANGVFDAGEAWTFRASGTVQFGPYANTAKASSSFGTVNLTTADASNYFGRAPEALIAPTNTTAQQYINGTALTFEDFYASHAGVIEYGVRSGKINSTNPGVFFYFTGGTGQIIGADGSDADSLADAMTVVIDQTRTSNNTRMTTPFQVLKNGVQLYKVISSDSVVDATDTLVTVKPTSVTVNSDGDISVSFTPDAVNTMYLVSVKYSTETSFLGSPISNPASWPVVNYDFDTKIGSAIIETYAGGIDLAPKPVASLQLEGEEGAGAAAIRSAQTKAAYAAALAWWEGKGFDVSELKQQTVEVADLAQQDAHWVLGMTHDGRITIDDDAANHGWSLGVGKVASGKVDLLSVLVHEVGHLLGHDHEQMSPTLGVGLRSLPVIDNIEDAARVANAIPLVGASAAEFFAPVC